MWSTIEILIIIIIIWFKDKYLYVLDHLKKKETPSNNVCIWLIPFNVIRVFVFPKKKKSGKFIVKYL